MCDRPLWPPGAEIAAQAFDDFAEWCLAHPDDCVLKQSEFYADDVGWHRGVRYWIGSD
jgi:hypothetical protein